MTGVATAVVGSAVIGGVAQSNAAGKAADAQTKAAEAGISAQQAAAAEAAALGKPFVDIGTSAANELGGFLGLDPLQGAQSDLQSARFALEDLQSRQAALKAKGGSSNRHRADSMIKRIREAQTAFDRAQIAFDEKSALPAQPSAAEQGLDEINPVVSFLRDQGFEQIQESAAARNRLGAGGTLKDLTQFNTDLTSTVAPQLQNQRFNQLFNVLSAGQNAAAGQGTATLNTASNIGNLLNTAGRAQAGGIVGQSNALTGTLQNVAGAAGAFPNLFEGGGGGAGTPIRPPGGETNLFQPNVSAF